MKDVCMDLLERMRYEMQENKMANLGDVIAAFKALRSERYKSDVRLYNFAEKGEICFVLQKNAWHLMVLAGCIDMSNEQLYEHYRALVDLYREAMRGLLAWQDKKTGLFHHVIHCEESPLDVNGTAMAAAALIKGVRLGVMNDEKYMPIAESMLRGMAAAQERDEDLYAMANGEYMLARKG